MPEFLHKSKMKNEPGTIVFEWLIHKPKNPILFNCVWHFPSDSDDKESICNAEHLGSTPSLGSFPGGGHGNPLHYSCLENPHRQRSLAGYSPGGCKQLDTTERPSAAQQWPTYSEKSELGY